MKKVLFIILTLVLAACSEDEAPIAPELVSPQSATYNSSCQTDTIRFTTTGAWTATVDDKWVTLIETQGEGDGKLPIYIQQNDDEQQRKAVVTITAADGQTLQVNLTQRTPEKNGNSYVDLPDNFGLGWGYDMREDIADAAGLRGQVFDHALLRNDYKNDVIRYNNATFTDLVIESGNSHVELQGRMGARFSGEADLFIAGAKVSVEYSDQIHETKDTRYVWCRDMRGVKKAFFFDLDYGSDNLSRYNTTSSFFNSVFEDSAEIIVRKFGTHVIIQSTLGGKLDYYFTLSNKVTTETETVVTYVQVKVLFIKKSWTDYEQSVWTNIESDFKGRFHVTGGGAAGEALNNKLAQTTNQGKPLDDPTLFDAWSKCFEDPNEAKMENLAMIGFEVIPIWDIVEPLSHTKAKAIEDYVRTDYLSKEKAQGL
jgi:major membrane immunogen (membrane-anchored lipoprotein)